MVLLRSGQKSVTRCPEVFNLRYSFQVLSEITGKAVTDVMAPHKDVLQDMIPPKKHLLRHQPINAQVRKNFLEQLKLCKYRRTGQKSRYLCESHNSSVQFVITFKLVYKNHGSNEQNL
jgi:hypothetical protein